MSRQTVVGEAPVTLMYKTLGIKRSTWYAAAKRLKSMDEASNGAKVVPINKCVPTARVTEAIKAVVDEFPAWGVRKVWATLQRQGLKVGRRRVWEIMRDNGWTLPAACTSRKEPPRGHVTVPYPNRRFATDLTTVQTAQDGTVAVVITVDCGCRSVLDVTVTKSQEATPVLASVDRALTLAFGYPERVPHGMELRSDHGPQYTGKDAERLLDAWGVTHTFSPVGRPTGNAVAERTIQTMKLECIWLQDFDSIEELDESLQKWRYDFNHRRPHQALGYATPAEFRANALTALYKAA